jgi:hypothetical protein
MFHCNISAFKPYENTDGDLNLGLVHPVAPVFNKNHKSLTFVHNLSCIVYSKDTISCEQR